MWKVAFTLLIGLCSIIGVMLFWQWHAYSEYHNPAELNNDEKAVQRITVESSGSLLFITQVIEGLQNDTDYSIVTPQIIVDWECTEENGETCEVAEDNPHMLQTQNKSFTFQYQIEIRDEESVILLKDWMLQLQDVDITHTTINLIATSRREGSWVTGFPLKGYSKLEYIDYYVFEGKGDRGALYWQPTPLEKIDVEHGIQFYTTNGSHPVLSLPSLMKIPNYGPVAIVFSDSYSSTNGAGLMIVNPSLDDQALERRMISHYFLEKASHFPVEERWLLEVLTSLVDEQESNIVKANRLIDELNSYFSKDQLEQFVSLVYKEDHITPQKLDELLGYTIDKRTDFFTLNKNEKAKWSPLYFYDSRPLIIGDKDNEGLDVFIVNNERYLPFVETMTALGYSASLLEDHESVLLELENNYYRFYVNQNIYEYNQVHYGLLENPLKMINGKPYMKSSMLLSLFQLSFMEDEEGMYLNR
ncbi:hypothetical protein ABE096_09330 [Robertmurraya massiliosenegalensis]|uniref:hypothetical protein n=1 Tax=Robertmurraya TaxID=2837507 RepID=UPI0039A5FE53